MSSNSRYSYCPDESYSSDGDLGRDTLNEHGQQNNRRQLPNIVVDHRFDLQELRGGRAGKKTKRKNQDEGRRESTRVQEEVEDEGARLELAKGGPTGIESGQSEKRVEDDDQDPSGVRWRKQKIAEAQELKRKTSSMRHSQHILKEQTTDIDRSLENSSHCLTGKARSTLDAQANPQAQMNESSFPDTNKCELSDPPLDRKLD